MARRANGEGSIYRRKDGRYDASAFFLTASGARKRVHFYGATRQEAHSKLTTAMAQAQQGTPMPDKSWRLGDYLDYWLREVVQPNRRATTYERYEGTVRLYLKPKLGGYLLNRLSVAHVQTFLNQRVIDGFSVRNVQIMREVLRAALTRAMREELITRNVASLVELPKVEPREVTPWTVEEVRRFLKAATGDPLHVAFLLAVLYGLRRGEVLGLRWCDVNLDASLLCIRQQVQRIQGQLRQTPLKTRASRRDLPLIEGLRLALSAQYQVTGTGASGLVFATSTGQPIEPRNYVRSFNRICEKAGVRRIRIHDMRHTAATLLKKVSVPARDAQLILGHSTVLITQEIYQHDDMTSRTEALEQVERLFMRTIDSGRCRQIPPLTRSIVAQIAAFIRGEEGDGQAHDIVFWRSIEAGVVARATEVNRVAHGRRRRWLLGAVAVSVAVKLA